jgi:hypothetical protein
VGDVVRRTATLHLSHGLTEETDLFVQVRRVGSHVGDAVSADESDWTDAIVGVKQLLTERVYEQGTFSVLLAPSIKTPIGNYEENTIGAIGDGQTDYRARAIAHWQSTNTECNFFAAVEAGYDKRSGEPKDEVPLNITVGFTVLERLTLMPFFAKVQSQGGSTLTPAMVPSDGGFPGLEEDSERFGLSAYFRVHDDFGLTAQVATTTDGKNTGDTESFAFGVAFRF